MQSNRLLLAVQYIYFYFDTTHSSAQVPINIGILIQDSQDSPIHILD